MFKQAELTARSIYGLLGAPREESAKTNIAGAAILNDLALNSDAVLCF